MPRLNKRTVDLAEPAEKDLFVWDGELPAFGLKVTPAGRKVFFVQYRIGKRSRRLTIGPHGAVTAEQARIQAQAILRQVARGDDPMAEADRRKNEVATGAALEEFLSAHAQAKLKSRSSAEYRRLVSRLVPAAIRRKEVTDITRAEISRLHGTLSKTPYQANRLLAVLRKFFNWCEERGYRQDHSNPTLHVKPFNEDRRERFLSEIEIARLGDTLAELETESATNPFVIAAVRLLMLTGARLNEILTLKWDWVDFSGNCARLPDSKTGAKTLYLNAPALEILSRVPRLEGNPHVICGAIAGASLVNLEKPWRSIRSRVGLDDVRLHDLRHTFASVAVASGMSLPMIGKLLGHRQPQTTARYIHLADDPMKAAAALVGRKMDFALRSGGRNISSV